ncbi:Triosephosphate isomerase A [Cucumispora dikerogammari]|nr:Triosephosphate isomerase A [Cucumispora dikerogammari]
MKNIKYVIGNHKNKPHSDNLIPELLKFSQQDKTRIIVCPSLITLFSYSESFINLKEKYGLGLQHITPTHGTCTGEINTNDVLKRFPIKYVIIGHNERRTLLNESACVLEKQIQNALLNKLTPIFCISQQANEAEDVLISQLEVYKKYSKKIFERIIAYEPAFAIGTGITPSVSEITETVKRLRNSFNEKVFILYGGSVAVNNCKQISEVCDGLLIGGSSLSTEFLDIVNKVAS